MTTTDSKETPVKLTENLNVHRFSAHRDGTKRWFLNFDMPMPLTCRRRGHRVERVDLGGGQGYEQCGRCFRRPPSFDRRAELGIEASSKARWALSGQISIGTAGSETPLDAHVLVPKLGGLFVGTNIVGYRLAHMRSRRLQGTDGQYEAAVTALAIDRDQVRWLLASPRDRHTKGTPRWRDGRWSWRDALLGKVVHSHGILATADTEIPMPEGRYPAQLTLEVRSWNRKRWPHADTHVSVDVRIEGGIPNGRQKYGDWDSTWGFGVVIEPPLPASWEEAALPLIVERMLEQRERYADRGWVPPAEARNPRMIEREVPA